MSEQKNGEDLEILEENHQGRNAQRIRIYYSIKQEVLAKELGISQPQLSQIENQPVIEDSMLQKLSVALGVTPDLIRKFDVARAIYNINHYKDSTINGANNGSGIAHQQINPLEKVVELYERLLNSEREKIEILLNAKK
jgi:transcriptional regulator with XRE-family HTH domain